MQPDDQKITLNRPVGGALAGDTYYVADLGLPGIIGIDLATGIGRCISGESRGVGPSFYAPFSVAVDDNENLLVVDTGALVLFSVATATGDRFGVSDLADPRLGPALISPMAVCVNDGQVAVLDRGTCAVYTVDRQSGQRTLLCGQNHGTTRFKAPLAMCRGKHNEILVVDPDAKAIFSIDSETGQRSVLSCSAATGMRGEGSPFHEPVGAFYATDNELWVGDLGVGGFITVEVGSGNRTSAAPKVEPLGLMISATGRVEAGKPVGYCVDKHTNCGYRYGGGKMTPLGPGGGDPTFEQCYDLKAAGDDLLVMDRGSGLLSVVNLSTGEAAGVDRVPDDGRSFGVVQSDAAIYCSDYTSGSVWRIDGKPQLVSSSAKEPVGEGPDLALPAGMCLADGGEELYVVGLAPPSVYAIDIATGRRRVVTANSDGAGPDFERIFQPRLGPNGLLYICDMGLSSVFFVDVHTGQRGIVSGIESGIKSGIEHGEGIALRKPLGLDVARDGTIYVADFALNAIVAVDAQTGHRRLISDNTQGSGPAFTMPISVATIRQNELAVFDLTQAAIFLVDLSTGDRRQLAPCEPSKSTTSREVAQ